MKVTINEREYELKELTKEEARAYIGKEVYVWDNAETLAKKKLVEVFMPKQDYPFCALDINGKGVANYDYCAPVPEEWCVIDLGKVVKGKRYHTTTTPFSDVVDHGSEEYCRQKAQELNEQKEKTKRPCTREELIEMLKKQGLSMLKEKNAQDNYTVDIRSLTDNEITLGHGVCFKDYRSLCEHYTLIDGKELWAEEYTINAICEACSLCSSKGYIGCDKYRCGKQAFQDGAKYGYNIALREFVERVEKDQTERQIQTINVIELKAIIKEMGVDL